MKRLFRPSQAKYWSRCPAQPTFAERTPPKLPGDPAREGTCAAWVGEQVLIGNYSKCHDMIGMTHENGWLVDRKMTGYCQEYVDMVRGLGGSATAEEIVTASADPLIEGTLDSSTMTVTNGTLFVIDLKYGFDPVEAIKNPQLIIYGKGKLNKFPPGTIDQIVLAIFQPRGFHHKGVYREWVLTPAELERHFNELLIAAKECEKPNPEARPGTWCNDCDAASSCVALAETSHSIVYQIRSIEQRQMNVHELSSSLEFAREGMKIVRAHAKAVEAEAEARCKLESIPGWVARQKYGHRKFTQPGVTVELITGVSPWDNEICTPAELERRGADKELVKKLCDQPKTGFKLEQITPEDIAETFKTK